MDILVPKYCLRSDIRGCSDYVNDYRESLLGTQLFCGGSSIVVLHKNTVPAGNHSFVIHHLRNPRVLFCIGSVVDLACERSY